MTESLFDVTDFDSYLSGDSTFVLSASQAAVRAYCGWHIAPVITETVEVDGGWCGDKLFLPSLHVLEVSDITVGEDSLDLDTVEVSQAGYVRRFGGWWATPTYGARNASVTMTHGYEDTPADLLSVVFALASRAKASPGGVASQSAGPFQISFGVNSDGSTGGVLASRLELAVLNAYKLRRIA